jgi:hypothetical protein
MRTSARREQARLVPDGIGPYLCGMRIPLIITAIVWSVAAPSLAADPGLAKPAPSGPKQIGAYEDWTAATNQEAGQTVCYAFTRAQSSEPSVPGRGDVVLTVTERPSGRDAVAISAGFNYPPGSSVNVQADQENLNFYTAHRSAFARDGRAAVAAFEKANTLAAKSPNVRSGEVTDRFSLRGFTAAYAAINKACPSR